MVNQVVLVGRLAQEPTVETCEGGAKRTVVNLAVNRGYKNLDGIYETDFFRCVLWNAVAETTTEYCRKGDVIGVKGRLQTGSYEKDGETKYTTDVIAEKVTFLSSKKEAMETQEVDE